MASWRAKPEREYRFWASPPLTQRTLTIHNRQVARVLLWQLGWYWKQVFSHLSQSQRSISHESQICVARDWNDRLVPSLSRRPARHRSGESGRFGAGICGGWRTMPNAFRFRASLFSVTRDKLASLQPESRLRNVWGRARKESVQRVACFWRYKVRSRPNEHSLDSWNHHIRVILQGSDWNN